MRRPPNPKEIALDLVRSVGPEIEAALMKGTVYRAASTAIFAKHRSAWEQTHDLEVVPEAWELLGRLGPAHFLTPYGAELAGFIPKGSSRRYDRSKKAGPHWLWLALQWLANWR